MFGYIKPDKENLLVKDLALYKAVYCGLCSVIKKEISFFLPFTLSYDFVFLTMIRSSIQGEKCKISKGKCKYNPLKKCAFSVCENETLYTARSALILTTLKLEDDINDKDTTFIKKLIIKPLYIYLSRKMKKLIKSNNEFKALISNVRTKLAELSELEKNQSTELDKACELFGDIMSEITSFSIAEDKTPIAKEIGSSIGRYIYLLDAADDLEKDRKSGAYNPLIARYGSCKEAQDNFNEIDIALSMYTKRAVLAFNLLEENAYTRIINNTLNLGLGAEAYKIMSRNGDKNDRPLQGAGHRPKSK